MDQLVGQTCTLCDKRIGSDLDGEFCGLCGCPVHLRCAEKANRRAEHCRHCGTSLVILDARVEEEARELTKRADDARTQQATLQILYGFAWIIGGALASMFCFGAASASGSGTYVIWTGAIAAGLGHFTYGLLLSRKRRPPDTTGPGK